MSEASASSLRRRKGKNPPAEAACVIAIVGGSGAGKSWLVERLTKFLGRDVCRVQMDDFYHDRSHLSQARRNHLNFDVPAAIDWDRAEEVLEGCRAGRPVEMPRYDFVTFAVTAHHGWRARPIVLVDGLWWLRSRRMRELIDLKLFLDVPEAVRAQRRKDRDVVERGYTPEGVDHQLRTRVLPLHERYVEPQKRWADLVLRQPYSEADVAQLAAHLWRVLRRGKPGSAPTKAFSARLARLLSSRTVAG